MLFAFYDAQADKGTGLRAYIFLGGEHSEGGLRYVIVPDAEAEAAAASFTTLSSRHIYSLQRALPKVSQPVRGPFNTMVACVRGV